MKTCSDKYSLFQWHSYDYCLIQAVNLTILHGGLFVQRTVLTEKNTYTQGCSKIQWKEIAFPGNSHSAKAVTYLVHKNKVKN